MTIAEIIAKYSGIETNGADWWPDGVWETSERIVEIPWHVDYNAFTEEMNAVLDANNPIQYIADADDNSVRTFLYYSVS